MKCKDCVHWKRDSEHTGNCECDKFIYVDGFSETPIDGLGYWDYECYKAKFETGEDFGCIHFKPKDK